MLLVCASIYSAIIRNVQYTHATCFWLYVSHLQAHSYFVNINTKGIVYNAILTLTSDPWLCTAYCLKNWIAFTYIMHCYKIRLCMKITYIKSKHAAYINPIQLQNK